jgi:hypothetical protein
MKAIGRSYYYLCRYSCAAPVQNKPGDSKQRPEEQIEEKSDTANLEYDTEFAVFAADAGTPKVQAGTLVSTKATSPKLNHFAQTMIDDPGKRQRRTSLRIDRLNPPQVSHLLLRFQNANLSNRIF